MEIIEQLRGLFGDNGGGDSPPSRQKIMEALRGVRAEKRSVEQRLGRLQEERADLLLQGTAEEIEQHDAEIRRAETEIERLEATASELANRAKEAKQRETLQKAHETLERLPALAADFEEARDRLREAEDLFSTALVRMAQLGARVRRYGHALHLPDEDLERLQAVADQLPGEHNLDHLRAPARPDPNRPRVVHYIFEGRREFFGDWSDEELLQVGALPPYITDEGQPREVFHPEEEEV